MSILVTGVAGFIGFHVALALLARGERVVGIDNINDYYDTRLKEARLAELQSARQFAFSKLDIADREAVFDLIAANKDLESVIHLAAQPGVRYSLENPYAYIDSNIMGSVVILEAARRIKRLSAIIYASSSSVYGGNRRQPSSIDDPVNQPISLYAASKASCELIAHSYSHLYGLPATGLRYFTTYGPWGRPDMATWLFTEAIISGRPIKVFNNGQMARDFTYIDDIVVGTLAAHDRPAASGESGSRTLDRLYNLGNRKPEKLLDFIAVIEQALGRVANKEMLPMQPGEVLESCADIGPATRDLGFEPKTSIEEGIPRFVSWYKKYCKID
ncbi:MAG: SDR family NAD(P)-dependent oxidoreductase [Stellaceae bacterium]